MWPFKKKTDQPKPSGKDMYSDLRNMVLTAKPPGLESVVQPGEPYGILMEMGVQGGSATMLSMRDGSMSLYFSGGGGLLRAQAYPNIREAGAQFFSAAQQFTHLMTPTTSYPLPGPHRVRFYILTPAAALTYEANIEDLGYNRDPMSPLFHAGDRMLTQMRLISQELDKKQSR